MEDKDNVAVDADVITGVVVIAGAKAKAAVVVRIARTRREPSTLKNS